MGGEVVRAAGTSPRTADTTQRQGILCPELARWMLTREDMLVRLVLFLPPCSNAQDHGTKFPKVEGTKPFILRISNFCCGQGCPRRWDGAVQLQGADC